MSTRIELDRYVYEDIYPSFKAATDEKEVTARINRIFLNHLVERELVLTGTDPALVADIGCGPCDTLVRYLSGVSFPPGFDIRATDFIPKYADSMQGEAVRTLKAAQAENVFKLVGFETHAGDAFAGNLQNLLSSPKDQPRIRQAFSVVFASHVMYHADGPSGVKRLLDDVADNILARDGICVLYHIANTPRTFQEFRARFGSRVGDAVYSDTGAVTINDPPAQIRAACDAGHLPLYEGFFTANLSFGPLQETEWRAFADLRAYDRLAETNPSAYEDLKRLYFIVQRAPVEFAADHSRSGLTYFIREIRDLIESNKGVLPLSERIQVFTHRDAILPLAEAIPQALVRAVANI